MPEVYTILFVLKDSPIRDKDTEKAISEFISSVSDNLIETSEGVEEISDEDMQHLLSDD